VPIDKLCSLYRHAHDIDDMPANLVNQIAHFFEHYKDLDEGKPRRKSWRVSRCSRTPLKNLISRLHGPP
jgi:inorganic pyrophosphatase